MRRVIALLSCALMLITSHVSAKDVEYRLPSSITPTFQQIHLNIDPDTPAYSGTTVIDITVKEDTKKVGFYQQDLTVTGASLTSGDNTIALSVSEGDYNMNWGSAEDTIAKGKYKLHITFEGEINKSSDGMYLSSFEGRNYIFTQFEDMHARKAFPSFDEPAFKIPYQMTITSPEKQVVVSNTPVESRSVEDGMQTVKFEKTKPMPTYLIAYTVGPFDSAELTGLSVPGKVYVPKGYADKTKFIVKHTPEILTALENFFDIKYPYKKLDFVAVPNFTHGAMENVGLITYRDSLLLLEDNPPLTERSGPLNVIAHELAHQWFGNLVTMQWWDDLWLNEAFASWAASYTMKELYPELNFAERIVQEGAFGADASPTVKPVKKVVRIQPDVMDGLGLNYSKGESILQMIESLIGTEKFREGVRNYMNTHAWRNTVADDLWAALDGVSDFNLSAMMKAYLEQPGYPLISIDSDGKVTQSRFHYAGADVKAQTWAVPLKLTYKVNGKIKQEVVFIDKKTTRLPQLAEAEWVFPNDDATGYFRWAIPASQLNALLNDLDALNNREKKNVLYNTQALLNAGEVGIDSVMPVLNTLAQDDEAVVKRAAVGVLGQFTYLVDDSNRSDYALLLTQEYMPVLNQLTLSPSEGETESEIKLRNSLYGLLGTYANNDALIKKSEKLAKQYISDPTSVPSAIAGIAIAVSTKHGNPEMFDNIIAAYKQAELPNVKQTLLYSMRYSDTETVNKMLDIALTDLVTPANTLYMVVSVARNLDDQTALYAWMDKNLDALISKMPEYHVSRMPEFVSRTCDTANFKRAEDFYAPIKDKYEGMARSYTIMVDSTQQCLRLKDTFQDDFNRYLSEYAN
ncbi:M1 family peptidase [Alteromonas sp. 345S023]|uniref:Aminopeptidase n=2 Tax=Alteromonas profundi TaxID=2696062 RepID=A0A7X5RKN5_9ALTE|nr:M1 family peptidase [Alteromonas profundi]